MQLDVHRLRFGNWVPSAIKSIAVDPSAPHMVAVGRVDGDIEIYNGNSKWYKQCHIAGKKNFKLQQLFWSTSTKDGEKYRLFGISLRGFIFEVDVKSLSIVNVSDTYGDLHGVLHLPLLHTIARKSLLSPSAARTEVSSCSGTMQEVSWNILSLIHPLVVVS